MRIERNPQLSIEERRNLIRLSWRYDQIIESTHDAVRGLQLPEITYQPEIIIPRYLKKEWDHAQELLFRCSWYNTADLIAQVLRSRWGLLLVKRALLEAHLTVASWWEPPSINVFIEDIQHPWFQQAIDWVRALFRPEDAVQITFEINEKPCDITSEFERNLVWLDRYGYKVKLDDISILDGNPDESITRMLLLRSRLLRYSSILSKIISWVKIDYRDAHKIQEDPHLGQRLSFIPYGLTITMEWMRRGCPLSSLPYRITHAQIHEP